MKAIKVIFNLILTFFILISIWFIFMSTIAFNDNFYEKFFIKHNLEAVNHIDQNESLNARKNLDIYLNYNIFQDKDNLLEDTTVSSNKFTEKEIEHMEDVKFLFNVGLFIFIITLITTSIYTYNMIKKYGIKGLKYLYYLLIHFLGIIILLIYASIDFQNVFFKFHELIFTNDKWLLHANDLLILLLPRDYFFNIAILSVFLTLVFSAALLLLVFILNKKTYKKL